MSNGENYLHRSPLLSRRAGTACGFDGGGDFASGRACEVFRGNRSGPNDYKSFQSSTEDCIACARGKRIHVEVDSRLSERVLSSRQFKDWMPKLEDTFFDIHLKYEGGESTSEAMERVCHVGEGIG